MKDFFFSSVKDFRYERKFYIGYSTKGEIEATFKFHPAIFREIYQERIVNNIYFDSFDKQHYFNNIDGINRRLKVRIRWYGDLFGFIKDPILELKLKHNLHVSKLLYPLKSFTLDGNFSLVLVREIFKESSLHTTLEMYLKGLNFSLLNSYNRKYFLSADRQYRITLDANMKAYRLSPLYNTFLHKTVDKGIVLELKYAKHGDDYVDNITNHFPFRMTRSSKYITGVENLSF